MTLDIRFDIGPNGPGDWFRAPLHLIEAWDAADVPDALAALDRARAEGHWLAGYCSYELGYALESCLTRLMPNNRKVPLIRFGVYDAPQMQELANGPAQFGPLQPHWDQSQYRAAFDTAHAYIRAGDIYQVNLTFPLSCTVTGTSQALYAGLMDQQSVGYGVLIEQDGAPDLLCRSPELFFRLGRDGQIETLPMKGTQPRGDTPQQDQDNIAFLQSDEKNQAENLMIVDLLRNDLSRVSELGSVKVPNLFTVQSFETVHQMVSRVTAQLMPDLGLGDVLRAIYPCGSITGAPKIRAMEIIDELEPQPRDAYCGTVGWVAPDGRATFNVAIRTLMVEGDGDNRIATLNVGGGVVYDSQAAGEYEEALWKTRFAQKATQTFD